MCCLLAFCTVWRRARLRLELFASTVGWFLSQMSYLSSYVFLRRRRSWIVTKRLPFLGMNILKISFQFSTYTAKKTPFRSEIMRYITTSSKQTRPFYVRIEIKTLVNLRMLFAYMSPESGQMDALESVYWFLLFWTVYCEFYSMFSTVLIPSFGLLCMAFLVLKPKTLLSDLEA